LTVVVDQTVIIVDGAVQYAYLDEAGDLACCANKGSAHAIR